MKRVLLVTIGFRPNVGGIETHFDDLIKALTKKKWGVFVLTYQPITTKVNAPYIEKHGLVQIVRLPIFKGLFYKLIKSPILEFLYLTPLLFLSTPFVLFIQKDISTIHSHGLIAGFVAVFWGKLFGKKIITTTHSIYNFPPLGLYKNFARWIFNSSDHVLTLSRQSKREIESLGIMPSKITVFTYWVDQTLFKPDKKAKSKTGWGDQFSVLFVGRLIPEKGISKLLAAAKRWDSKVILAVAGTGPMEGEVINATQERRNIKFLGRLTQRELAKYYAAADVLIVPSTHEEGFGRVILEALSSGTPVIGSNRGAIPEAVDESVGILVPITVNSIVKTVEKLSKNRKLLSKLKANAFPYALKRYSYKNAETILSAYR